ncbi:hypothetical protein WA588_000665 [Blastocystis sp. NMH]
MDKTDLGIFPCPCNFQICLWCLDTLIKTNRPCPNCRRPYKESDYRFVKQEEEPKPEEKPKEETRRTLTNEDAHDLQVVRVIQKNLVYVIGIPLESATEENLRRQDMFGQYGHLSKIVINSRNPVGDKSNTCGVYLTYDTDEQALACIRAVDGFTYCRRQLKASYGTTKYCFAFIRGQKCSNPDCLYLHHLAPKEDCFTKEEMTTRQHEFYQLTHPGNGSSWDEHQQRYVYRRPSEEYATSLPPLRLSPKLQGEARKVVPRGSGVASVRASEEEKSVVSEIATPKEAEEPLLMPPTALIGFSQEGRKAQQPPIPVALEESMVRMIPFSFELVGYGIRGSTFGFQNAEKSLESKCGVNV